MTEFEFPPPEVPAVAVAGSTRSFPVRRIFCVGRNYEEHAREMGGNPDREPPFFFTKPADAVVANGAIVPYPPRTANLHHEIELVVAVGTGGSNIPREHALAHVFGYAAGNDLTRRDLQLAARDKGRPWDVGKAFDHSAIVGAIRPAREGHVSTGRIWLAVNGELRQDSDLARMTWSVPEIIAELSTLFTLAPGDLIFTGTPAGVGPVKPGDRLEGGVADLQVLRNTLVGP